MFYNIFLKRQNISLFVNVWIETECVILDLWRTNIMKIFNNNNIFVQTIETFVELKEKVELLLIIKICSPSRVHTIKD